MHKEKILKDKKDFLVFFTLLSLLFSYSLLIEYNNYKNLTSFSSSTLYATVLKQYTKISKKNKKYQVLKLKAENGYTFYTRAKNNFPPSQNREIELRIYTNTITFYAYLTSFFANSKIIFIKKENTLKHKLNTFLEKEHTDEDISSIYKALYTATSLPKHLQNTFASLGISHLFAISGFHLGVLSSLLYFILKYPYKLLQNNYFPYRSYSRDVFFIIVSILFFYLVFLNTPHSLLRSFAMLVIGFILYDRGYKIISMQTLLLSVLILIALYPRLLFSLGFWLSVWGVFYIFIFLMHFKNKNKVLTLLFISIWVYLMMLPISLYIFNIFSLYHPFSVVLSILFSFFYPLSLVLHIVGLATLLDPFITSLLSTELDSKKISLSNSLTTVFFILSFLAIYKKIFALVLFFLSCGIFIYSINYVT